MDQQLEKLMETLLEGNENKRFAAVTALGDLDSSNEQLVRLLEKVVITDSSPAVQQAALDALALPLHQRIQRTLDQHFMSLDTRRSMLRHVEIWFNDGLLTPQVTALLKGRCALEALPLPPSKPVTLPEEVSLPVMTEAVPMPIVTVEATIPVVTVNIPPEEAPVKQDIPVKKAEPVKVEAVKPTPPLPIRTPRIAYDGEIALAEDVAPVIKAPLLEKQKFSLIGTLTSETTIKIALYLGAFLIIAAAIIFAGLVEPARLPMLTTTIIGFLSAAYMTRERLPLGSFVLFVIGTLLFPIDAAVFFALFNIKASLVYWSVVAASMSAIWAAGTYLYQSRFFSLMIYATFSIATYLIAASLIPVESAGFLFVVSLVALAGLGEATFLRRWQGDSFFEPMFAVVQLQMLAVMGALGGSLLVKIGEIVIRVAEIEEFMEAAPNFDGIQLVTWLSVGGFYFASDDLTRRMKKWGMPIFRVLVIGCLMTPPVFIMDALSTNFAQIALVLWVWGAGTVLGAEVLTTAPVYWRRTYPDLLLWASFLFLLTAPVVAYIAAPATAIIYLAATSGVYFLLAYRHKAANLWSVGLTTAYLGYLIGVSLLNAEASVLFPGFAILIPALVFFAVELTARRYFRAAFEWTAAPLLFALFNAIWDIGILLSWYSEYPEQAALIFVIYGVSGTVYASLSARIERDYALVAWVAGLLALYTAYFNLVTPINEIEFGGYILLAPAVVFLTATWVGKRYFQLQPFWTQPLLTLGLVTLVVDLWLTFAGGLEGYPASAAVVFLIYGLYGVLYATLEARSERRYAILAWTAGLIALYMTYAFGWLSIIDRVEIFPGYILLIPALVFLTGEMMGKLYLQSNRDWTMPLLALGLFNAAVLVPVTLGNFAERLAPEAALIAVIYGLFGVVYARLNWQANRSYAIAAWTVGMLALYVAYGLLVMLVREPLEIGELAYALLLAALICMSAELAGKLYLRASAVWTTQLLGIGLFNALLVVPIALQMGMENAPGNAALIFLIYGLFAGGYTALVRRTQRDYAVISWIAGLIACYVAYLFAMRLPTIEALDLFSGYILLIPALVFLAAMLVGKHYLRISTVWTLPMLALGLLNAGLVVPVTLQAGLEGQPGSAALIFSIYGLFAVMFARLETRSAGEYGVMAWTVGLVALYTAYSFGYLLALEYQEFPPGYALLLPAVVFLSGEMAGKFYFRAQPQWTFPLFILGLLNAVLVVPITLQSGLNDTPGSAALIFLIYGLFAMVYMGFEARSGSPYGVIAWTVGLVALYIAYGFAYLLTDIFPGFALLLPAVVFLAAELAGKFYFRTHPQWTIPLFALGLLNAALVVPVALQGGLNNAPGSAAITFLIYGLFAMVYMGFEARSAGQYGVIAWTVGLVALYTAYGFGYLLALEYQDIFPGYALLLPAVVFLSGEMAGKFYFRAHPQWTIPLFNLGLLSAIAVIPVTLIDATTYYPGSAAITCLIYGLFAAFYLNRIIWEELRYIVTISLALAVGFALRFYQQDHWVLPFIGLTLLYYLGGLILEYIYDRRDWSTVLHYSGLVLGTGVALSAPVQGGSDAVIGMGVIATLYGAEGFLQRNIWWGLPANGLLLGAYFLALQELNVNEPQFYSVGTGLLAIVTHYLLTRRSEDRAAFSIGFVTGVIAQLILLGTSFIQMHEGLQMGEFQYFLILFFEALTLLAYGVVTRSLSFTIIPILFVVGGVIDVVINQLGNYLPVITLGCTGLTLVILGFSALFLRERLLQAYEDFSQ